MSFTQDEHVSLNTSKEEAYRAGPKELEVNAGNPFAQVDYGVVIKAFEVEASTWKREDYIKANHYRDVYSTRHFAERTREQMDYYPGMHQTTTGVPGTDPFYTNAKEKSEDRLNYWDNAMDNPESFMSGLRENQKDFDYSKIFGSDISAENRATEIGKMITECVPCFDRLLDGMELLPDGDLLEIHALNIKIRTDLLKKIRALFKDPGMYINICDLLKMLAHLCPQDLLAINALLTQYLAKLNLDFKFNLDFIIQLVGPILSPFLNALSAWLDKWIQLILAPMICVVDHINETILLSQSLKIPFSDVSANVSMDLGVAAPAHKNAAGTFGFGGDTGFGDPREDDSYGTAWTGWQWEQFDTPDQEKYNPTVPTPPAEETQMAREEIVEAWNPSFSEAEREERNAKWQELKEREEKKRRFVPPPDEPVNRDGTRWSKDDIPNSEKYKNGNKWEVGYYPPEKQVKPGEATEYFVTTPIVDSIIQMRNILQGGIQYVKDWFTYITQMIYDLLGVDFGWMSKKADNTMLKSRIVQLILMVKSILEAIAKNGLQCGTHSNFNSAQMKYILEEELNQNSSSQFEVLEDGSIHVIPSGTNNTSTTTITDHSTISGDDINQDGTDSSSSQEDEIPGIIPGETISEPDKPADKQKFVESGIIIKHCFKSVSAEELSQARAWIADFEKRGNV
jgi:hypothetical protein